MPRKRNRYGFDVWPHMDARKCDDCLAVENTVKFKDYPVSREWHRPYVEAFFLTDEAQRDAVISEAERAIVERLLELSTSSVGLEEMLDLRNAAYAIMELKMANTRIHTPQHLVA